MDQENGTHTGLLYSHQKKAWVDLEGIMLSEINQSQTNTIYSLLYVESKKVKLLEAEWIGSCLRMGVVGVAELKWGVVNQRVQTHRRNNPIFQGSDEQHGDVVNNIVLYT